MSIMPTTPSDQNKNWFDQGGKAYARFRPEYPPELATFLASLAPDKTLAVDVGCGTGQLTQLLAPHFEHVMGLDPSTDQINNATALNNMEYRCAAAEQLPVADASTALVTAAQAAHWFDLPRFYAEARHIMVPDGIVALVSYGVLDLEPQLNERFQHFYWHEIGPYWPPERKLVDTGYATIDFPFEEITPPAMHIRLNWNLAEFLGYVSTWSAIRSAREAGREDVLQKFASELSALWGDPETRRTISWPINMRLGK